MGHENITLTGTGKTKAEAMSKALGDFFDENGHRYSVSKQLGARRLADIPPQRTVQKTVGRMTYISSEEWTDAPKHEWLQQWEFTIDFHV